MTATASTAPQNKSLEWMNRLRANPKIPLIVAGAAAIAILVAMVLWAKSPDYRTLYSNLSDQDGGAIVTQLTQMNIPYRFADNGGALEVPADKVHARMQQLVSEFQHTLDALDSVIASRLMQMALEAARQVIGQTPTVDNAALIKQIQGLLQQEPLFSGKPQLRVHPDDLQRVEDSLGATLSLHGWRLRGDPSLHHGGCKVSADEGDLDASVATRWQELCRLAAPGVV